MRDFRTVSLCRYAILLKRGMLRYTLSGFDIVTMTNMAHVYRGSCSWSSLFSELNECLLYLEWTSRSSVCSWARVCYTAFPNITGSNTMWTFQCIGQEGCQSSSEMFLAKRLLLRVQVQILVKAMALDSALAYFHPLSFPWNQNHFLHFYNLIWVKFAYLPFLFLSLSFSLRPFVCAKKRVFAFILYLWMLVFRIQPALIRHSLHEIAIQAQTFSG